MQKIILLVLIVCLSARTTIFIDQFESGSIGASKWAFQSAGHTVQQRTHGSTSMLNLNFSNDIRSLTSKWISASVGSWYLFEAEIFFSSRNIVFSPTNALLIGECNLPRQHFTLNFTYSPGTTINLVNPLQRQAIIVAVNTMSVVVTTNNSQSSCTLALTSAPTATELSIIYSEGDQSVEVRVARQSFRCTFSQQIFIYDILYYTVTVTTPTTLTVQKSSSEDHGLMIALESTETGCNTNSPSSDCLVIFGNDILSRRQNGTIKPAQSNVDHHLAYVFKNNWTRFRIILSDLKRFERNPIAYDTFIDSIEIDMLIDREELKVTLPSVANQLLSGVSEISYASDSSFTNGVQIGLKNNRFYEKRQQMYHQIVNVAIIKGTIGPDIIQTDEYVTTVYGYSGDDIILTSRNDQAFYTGNGNDIIVVSCEPANILLPDHGNNDIIDLTTFGITSLSSNLLSVRTEPTNTVMTIDMTNFTVHITIPSLVTIQLATRPTTVACNLDIGAGQQSSSDCIFVCPCNRKGRLCAFTEPIVQFVQSPTVSNVYCSGSVYSFESTPQSTALSAIYRLSSFSDQPHYQLAISMKMYVVGYTSGDSLTVWAATNTIYSSTLFVSRQSAICNPGLTGFPLDIYEIIPHYMPNLLLQAALQSTSSSSIHLLQTFIMVYKCYPSCSYCTGPQLADCVDCNPPFQFSDTGICQCPVTAVLVNPTVCLTCSSLYAGCLTCNSTNCLTCLYGIINSDWTCVGATTCVKDCVQCDSVNTWECIVCRSGYFLNSSTQCLQCGTNCQECSYSGCQMCQNGYQVNTSDTHNCIYVCHETCLTCNGPSSTNCLSCLAPRTLQIATNSCVCPFNHYSVGSVCTQCQPPCATCSSFGVCLSCLSTYILNNTMCICDVGHFEANSSCKNCPNNCVRCANHSTCLQCFYHYTINADTKLCEESTDSEQLRFVSQTTEITKSVIIISTISSLPLVLRGNPLLLLQLFDIVQEISFIQYIPVKVPNNFDSYLQLFIKINLDIFPNIVQDQTLVMSSPIGFADSNVDSFFFRNISSNVYLVPIVLGTYLLIKLMELVILRWCRVSCFRFIIGKLVDMFQWAGFITMVLGSYVSVCVACFLQLQNSSARNAAMYLSYFVSYIVLLAVMLLAGLIYHLVEKGEKLRLQDFVRNQQENNPDSDNRTANARKQYDRRFGMLYELYKKQKARQRNFSLFVILKKFIYSFNMVYLQEVVMAQLVFFVLTQLSLFVALLIIKPYERFELLLKDLTTQILCAMLYVSFMFYARGNLSASDQRIVGTLDIVLVTIIIVIHLVVLLYDFFLSVKQLCGQYSKFKHEDRNDIRIADSGTTQNVSSHAVIAANTTNYEIA